MKNSGHRDEKGAPTNCEIQAILDSAAVAEDVSSILTGNTIFFLRLVSLAAVDAIGCCIAAGGGV